MERAFGLGLRRFLAGPTSVTVGYVAFSEAAPCFRAWRERIAREFRGRYVDFPFSVFTLHACT